MIKKYSFNIGSLQKYFAYGKLKIYCICLLQFFLFLNVAAQKTVQESLQEQFDAHEQNTLQEKIFLHTDKDMYLAGEICWFKIYDVDAFFHQPLDISKIAYVELLDKNNKPVWQAKVALNEGDGNGSLQLPVSINSGKYKLRSYTNWMKNFSADYFFEKTLTIINSKKIYDGDTIRQKNKYDLGFFPEGGNLVNGVQSKIAFRVVDHNGKGILCQGVVISDKSDTLVKYSTLKFGIGTFLLTPEEGRTYKAVTILPNGNSIIYELPLAYNYGYRMQLTESANKQVKIEVRVQPDNTTTSPLYLFVHTRGSVKLVMQGNIQNGYLEFLVDKAKLGSGISHFTVFNSDKQPVCERLYFKYPEQRLEVEMTSDGREYETRKKINIQINTTNPDGRATAANMSMAVYRIDSLQAVDEMDINNYLWLCSDLNGTIESPEYYFKNKGIGSEEAVDNLMLTHGWRRFRWEDILQNKKPVFDFVPEYNGHVITGKITKTETGLPKNDIGSFLSVSGTKTQFRTSISEKNGRLKFDMKEFYNEGEVIVQTNTRQDTSYNIEILSPFIEKYSGKALPAFSLTQINQAAFLSHHVGMQVQSTYSGNKLKQFVYPLVDTNAFYFKPDATYLLDNYVRFTSMEEVLREYVTQINVRKSNGRFRLPVADALRKQFFDSDPLLLLDGVPIFDINKFMSYDPLQIRKLEVMSRPYYFGNMYFEGIANFVTYNGNLSGYELDPHATVVDYEGLQLQRQFFTPVYESREQLNSHLPDFRYLLYWNPDIKTNEKGRQNIHLYSSDIPGKYIVVLQGLTADGKTGSKVIQFEVKLPTTIANKQ
jgi:hypothetical protein